MTESYPLTFSDLDQKMYEKLDAAARDLSDCTAYGAFIIKKGGRRSLGDEARRIYSSRLS